MTQVKDTCMQRARMHAVRTHSRKQARTCKGNGTSTNAHTSARTNALTHKCLHEWTHCCTTARGVACRPLKISNDTARSECACARACVCPCMHACIHACVLACMHACVHAYVYARVRASVRVACMHEHRDLTSPYVQRN